MKRRSVLATVGAVVFSGCSAVGNAVDGISGTPRLENPIETVQTNGMLRSITFYESGAAELSFAADTGCYNQIGITHATKRIPADEYASWELPEFEGSVVADISGSLPDANFPDRQFIFELYQSGGGTCIGLGSQSRWVVTLPEAYIG